MNNATLRPAGLERARSRTDKLVLCSVIVCTRNRAVLLRRLLESLTRQSFPVSRCEVIVVDDASSDESAAVCHAFKGGLPGLQYLHLERHSGLAVAANHGVAAASGDLLLFTDDDCLPGERWTECLSTALQWSEIVAGAITSPHGNRFILVHNVAQFHPFLDGSGPTG